MHVETGQGRTILGIETSCDETAAAIITGPGLVRASVVATQFDVHTKYGGVVPELASRAHIENIDGVIQEALTQADVRPDDLDTIAVTCRPGLMGCLLIGLTAAKTLAFAWNKPLIGVNHVHAHAISAALALDADASPPWPAVSLVVSGGHTSLFLVRSPLDIEPLGWTIDDAAGEAFDKVASILDLGFPGGPIVSRLADTGNPKAVNFPRTMLKRDSLDFSFSGLKTAVLYHVHGPGKTSGGLGKLSERDLADICASFQAAVVDVLVKKTMRAVERTGVKTVLVGGGVAANGALRQGLQSACDRQDIALHLTPLIYCGDNGVMIAALGHHLFEANQFATLALEARASA